MIINDNSEVKGNAKLEVKNLYFSWPSQEELIIRNCSFTISRPGLWMLLGENGCGKSTLFKLLRGILIPSKGSIERPFKISMVFQNPDHQILMPTCGSELILNIQKKISKNCIEEKVQRTLAEVGMQGFFKRPVHTLSGGQKQRLAIASALISDSSFILMDEPTALLDEFSQQKVLKIITSLVKRKKNPLTVLWITHRLEELSFADKVATMQNGNLSEWQYPHNFKDI